MGLLGGLVRVFSIRIAPGKRVEEDLASFGLGFRAYVAFFLGGGITCLSFFFGGGSRA